LPSIILAMNERPQTVGVIGLGAMGAPMARRLLACGWPVVVYSRPGPVEPPAGAIGAEHPKGVAEAATVILLSLPDAAAVESVMVGPSGLGAGPPHRIVVDTSTIAPAGSRSFAAELGRVDIAYLDAPVSGGAEGAETGALTMMVGGEAADLERAKPVLDAVAATIVHCGPAGAGQLCKACNQLVVVATIEVVAEALQLAATVGLDPAVARDALLRGYAASRVLEVHGKRMLARDFAPGGKVKYNLKDLEIIGQLAREAQLQLPAFAAAAVQVERLIAAGGGELDNSALVTMLEQPGGPRVAARGEERGAR
jgi:2-hydroxy-3-oxopropionate reductase